MNGAQPRHPEHDRVAVTLATAIADRIAEQLPAIQAHLETGGTARGLDARVSFRLGMPGEGGVVIAEVVFGALTGDTAAWSLAPSAATGQLEVRGVLPVGIDPQVPQAPPAPQPHIPQQVPVPQQAPLPQRGQLAGPAFGEGLVPPPQAPVLVGAIPPAGPVPQQQAPLVDASATQALLAALTPQQQAAYLAALGAQALAPPPTPRKRLVRPPIAGDEGIR